MVEGGRTPLLSRAELQSIGYRIAIFPVAGLLAAAAAMRSVYSDIHAKGSTKAWPGDFFRFDDFSKLMGFERVWDFEREHAIDESQSG